MLPLLMLAVAHRSSPHIKRESINRNPIVMVSNAKIVVALNKVDQLYGWKTCSNAPILKALKSQTDDVQREFKWRVTEVFVCFIMHILFYYK
jgi:translation initiation factor 5B